MSEIETNNDFMIGCTGSVVAPLLPMSIRTKQQAYRTAAWIKLMGEMLRDEDVASSYDEIEAAIANS